MPGRRPREAVKAYVEPLQRNVALICKGVLLPNNYDRLEETSVLTLAEPCMLNRRTDLFLVFAQEYRVIPDVTNGPYRVTTMGYMYSVESREGEEIFGYHWHPTGQSITKFAHIHLGQGAKIGHPDLNSKAHFPTGRVAFEDIVALLIQVFGAKPNRPTWQAVAERTRSLFVKHKSW